MSNLNALMREIQFTARDKTVLFWLIIVLSLSSISVWSGLTEVQHQNATIQNLINADQQERLTEQKKLENWGLTAYHSFHLTYDPPSNFAYAAMGLRDTQPWKHRIRMLALEGQIYERDVGNPSVALIGRFDFAFFTTFIIPIIIIMILYNLQSSEKTAGRHALLEATAGKKSFFWALRALVRVGALFLSLIFPLIIAGIIADTNPSTLFLAILAVFTYIAFWTLVSVYISAWRTSGSVILMTLVFFWVLSAVILPAGSRIAIDRVVSVPSGTDILMLQRETVNDAWDLPREVTMDAFFKRHPQWSNYEPVKDSFEWPWYYAFQQVGDQKTEDLSTAYRNARLQRDQLAAWVSLITPPSLLERYLQSLAKTDLHSSIEYEESIRAYHMLLRTFYYPKLFKNEPFDTSILQKLPKFLAH